MHFVHGGLKQRISSVFQCFRAYLPELWSDSGIVLAHLRALSEETFKRITLLLEAELEPFTRNQHYFSDYKSKFLGYYKGVRQASQSNDFIRNLDSPSSSSFRDALTKTLTGLTEMGLQKCQPCRSCTGAPSRSNGGRNRDHGRCQSVLSRLVCRTALSFSVEADHPQSGV